MSNYQLTPSLRGTTLSSAAHAGTQKLHFGILNPQELLAFSVAEIKDGTLHKKQVPTVGGANDGRLGASRSFACATCQGDTTTCSGHFGHALLQYPAAQIVYIDYVYKTLKAVCPYCSRLLVGQDELRRRRILQEPDGKKRLQMISTLCNTFRVCGGDTPNKPSLEDSGLDVEEYTRKYGCGLDSWGYELKHHIQLRAFCHERKTTKPSATAPHKKSAPVSKAVINTDEDDDPINGEEDDDEEISSEQDGDDEDDGEDVEDAEDADVLDDNEEEVMNEEEEVQCDDGDEELNEEEEEEEAEGESNRQGATTAAAETTMDTRNGSSTTKKKRDYVPFSVRKAFDILRFITDEDARTLGWNPPKSRPEWAIHTVFPIPPTAIRMMETTVSAGGKGKKVSREDELSKKLREILRVNTALRDEKQKWYKENNIHVTDSDHVTGCKVRKQGVVKRKKLNSGGSSSSIAIELDDVEPSDDEMDDDEELELQENAHSTAVALRLQDDTKPWEEDVDFGLIDDKTATGKKIRTLILKLQYELASYVKSDLSGLKLGSQRSSTYRGFEQKLKGKHGRIRGTVISKRTNYCARTVITPNTDIDIDEIGVPVAIAKQLTFKHTVTPLNIHHLSELVRAGPNVYPGAVAIHKPDGSVTSLKYVDRYAQVLQFGWQVECHIQDGHPVILNRQPSLHKMSIMVHRVKIVKQNTLQLNLSTVAGYNADLTHKVRVGTVGCRVR